MNYNTHARYAVKEWDETYLRIDGEELQVRIYQPQGAGPFPGLVDVHGGAWSLFDRTVDFYWCRELAKTGIVVAALDFRLAPKHKYPSSIQDVNYGIRWLKSQAQRLSVNAGRVGLIGGSTGGHMAMLAALRPDDPQYKAIDLPEKQNIGAEVSFVIPLWPILDVDGRYEYAVNQPELRGMVAEQGYPRLRVQPSKRALAVTQKVSQALSMWQRFRHVPLPGYAGVEHWIDDRIHGFTLAQGVRPGPRKILFQSLIHGHEGYFARYGDMIAASPLAIVAAGRAQALPPVYILQGVDDANLTTAMTQRFTDTYRKAGGEIEFRQVQGVGHSYVNIPSHQADGAIAGIKAFVAGVLASPKSPEG